jgi:hypothetical protein
MNLQLDEWQEKVLTTRGNLCLRSGRQVGKSTVISVKAGEFAVKNAKKTVLLIAKTERQAYLLFDKIIDYVFNNYKSYIKKGKDRPTKSRLRLKNGSVIHCVPAGLTGAGIRGYTIDLLIADEAAFIPEEVWTAVTPMLATTKGEIILLSTPFGADNFFARCFDDPSYTNFHVSSEECARVDRAFLEQQKRSMTKLQYAQEYLGEFIDEFRQFFPTELIKKCCTGKRSGKVGKTWLGVDVARMGEDQTTFEIITERKDRYVHIESIVTEKTYTTDTVDEVARLNNKYNFTRIYIDDAGVGAGVFDILMKTSGTRSKTEGVNNAKKSIDNSNKKFRRILKNDLYDNLLKLMETSKIEFLDDDEVIASLKCVQFEYTDDNRLKIFGSETHIVEGLIRAAWGTKSKHLNLWAASKTYGI